MNHKVIDIHGLSLAYGRSPFGTPILKDVTFEVRKGEVMGLVGESGSGKSTLSQILLGYNPPGARIEYASATVGGQEVLRLGAAALRRLRGRSIAYVPQNPVGSLNPARLVGNVMVELLITHQLAASQQNARRIALQALDEVELPAGAFDKYPHQLSGGQQQRAVIAMALMRRPQVIVLDEPTTGLDVSTQKAVLSLLRKIKSSSDVTMVYVTHDLDVLREIATHAAVMYAGKIVEAGPIEQAFDRPIHPYTAGLMETRVDIRTAALRIGLHGHLDRSHLPAGCSFQPRCPHGQPICADQPPATRWIEGRAVACHFAETITHTPQLGSVRPEHRPDEALLVARDVSVEYRTHSQIGLTSSKPFLALSGGSLSVGRGEVVAIVGESGSGKSTFARALVGQTPSKTGSVVLDGKALAADASLRDRDDLRRVQLVFQNPDGSLNPRRRVGQILEDAFRAFFKDDRKAIRQRVAAALAEVKLPPDFAQRFPTQLSGGERQRVAIARALVAQPDVLVCDEILSALDVSVQASILELVRDLAEHRRMAVVFISHDLAVVRAIADRVAILYKGRMLGMISSRNLLAAPMHPYVRLLLESLPGLGAERALSLTARPRSGRGCSFHDRCRFAIADVCGAQEPPHIGSVSTWIACHLDPSSDAMSSAVWSVDQRRGTIALPGDPTRGGAQVVADRHTFGHNPEDFIARPYVDEIGTYSIARTDGPAS